MECLNPDCTKRERLKKLFHGVEKAEDLPEFCPYCQARLHRTLDESRNENLDLSPKAFEGVSETTTDAFSKESDVRSKVLQSSEGSKDPQNLIPDQLEGQTTLSDHSKLSEVGKNTEESYHGQEVPNGSATTAGVDGANQRTEHQFNNDRLQVNDNNRTVLQSLESSTLPKEHVLPSTSKPSDNLSASENTSTQAIHHAGQTSKEHQLQSAVKHLTDKEIIEDQKIKIPIDPTSFDHERLHDSDITIGLHHETQLNQTYLTSSSDTKGTDKPSGKAEETQQDSNTASLNQEVVVPVGPSREVRYPPGQDPAIVHGPSVRGLACAFEPGSSTNSFEKSGVVTAFKPDHVLPSNSNTGTKGHNSDTVHGPTILGSTCVFGSGSSTNSTVITGRPDQDLSSKSNTGITGAPQEDMETEGGGPEPGKKAFEHYVVEISDDGDSTSDGEEEDENGRQIQRSGPQRYDKDVIKQKRKERINKRKRGGKAKKSNNDRDDIEEKKQRIQEEQKPENSGSKKITEQSDNDDNMDTMSSMESSSSSFTQEATSHPLQHTQPSQQNDSVPPVPTWTEEDCVKIVFHAFLSSEFHFKLNKHKVTVRLGLYEVGGWKCNCTNMFNARKIKDNFIEVHGEMQLPVKFLCKQIPYKYVVITADEKVNWELSEYFDEHPHAIVNRCLTVIEDYKHPNAVWHQFDGVVYPDFRESSSTWYDPRTWGSGWKSKFDHAKVVKDREYAAISFLPMWDGFVSGDQIEQMTALEAIDRIKHLQECLSNPWISVSNYPIKKYVSLKDFPFKKILKDFLKPKLVHNASLKEDDLKKPGVRKGRLISSLTIAHLVKVFNLDFSYGELTDIINCLVLENHGNGRCDFDDLHMEFPENTWSEFSESVLHLLNTAAKKRSGSMKFCPDAILAVPLVHFLRKDTKPFEKCDDDSSEAKSVERWCHLTSFPQSNLYKKFVEEFFSKVQPMFVLDPYMRRLFLYYVPFEDFDKMCIHDNFPIHELCTSFGFKIEHIERKYLFDSKLEMIEKTLSSLSKRIKTELSQRKKHLDAEVVLQAKSAYLLANEIFNKNDSIKNKSFYLCIEIVSLILSSTQQLDDGMSSSEVLSHEQERDAIFFGLANSVEIAIEREFSSKLSLRESNQKEELLIWSKFLKADSLNGKLRDKWRETLLFYFVKRLKKLNRNDSIDLYCRVDSASDINQNIIEAITTHAFNEVERTVESGKNESSISLLRKKSLKDGVSSRAGELLSRIMIRSWNKETSRRDLTPHSQLLYILRWKHWPEFISSFGSAESQKILTPDAAKLVQRVVVHLCSIQHAIRSRSIDVQTMMLLGQYQDNFRKLCTALTKVDQDSKSSQKFIETEAVMKEFKKRSEELRHFQELKSHVGNFLSMCRSSKEAIFDTEELQRMHESDISEIELKDICNRDSMSEERQENQITVVFFDLPDSLRSELPQLSAICKSDIFHNFWKRNSRSTFKEKRNNNQDESGLSLTDIQKNVLQPSLETWKQLAKKLNSGFITLRDIDKYFTRVHLQKEVDIMFSSFKISKHEMNATMKQRMKEINQYRSLQKYIEATETVWNFKEALDLKGDFDIVEQLRNQSSNEFKEKALSSIDARFLQAGEYLQSISIEEAHCLQAVIDCEPLVKWLRETIKDTSALSTLVDLAMISAGENDLEVDRISNFHTSCLNFAPLIFDIREETGFDDLMKSCQPVWKAVEADKNLSEKLSETCRHLEWLKAVQSSHGSVEMSSLMQTKIINSSGIYCVGKITQTVDFTNGLEGVLTLTVPMDERMQEPKMEFEQQESDKKEDMKMYSLNDLKTLQSKLMLIAGKTAQIQNKEKKDSMESTEEINRFVEIFEGVMRLGQVYIDLCEAGDVKYLEWSEKIDCSEDRLFIDRSVGKKLANTCKEMEEWLSHWRQYVHDKRYKYKEFNHFSTKQILIMRRELGSVRRAGASINDLSLHVLTLLESVVSGITRQDLMEVLNKMSGFSLVATDNSSSEQPVEGNDLKNTDAQSKHHSFFSSLETMDFQEDVGIAALKASNAFDNQEINETDLLDWCMENGDNTELIESLVEQAREDPNFIEFFPELIDDAEDVLQDEMMSDDDNQNTEENSELDIEHEGYLTLNELGTVLVDLGLRGNKPSERRFPDYLKNDQPNLILVPSVDVYPTVLTLYMQYGGNSLPTLNEVLLCTSETTAEEVELFWWRSFQDTHKQIFCLVNPDVLDYNVSQTAVAMFNTLKQKFGSFKDHRVVIICSTENEDRSHIIAALDEYRLHATPSCAPGDILKSYLENKLTCMSSRNGYYSNEKIEWIPAAHLDSKRLSVRVISSNRAGVGKTLVVTRLCEKLIRLPNNDRMAKMRKRTEQLHVTVPLHGTVADTHQILDALWQHPINASLPLSRIIHLDVSPSISEGLETVLFNLVVLGVLQDTSGRLWRRRSTDLYVVELTSNIDVKVSSDTKKLSFVSLFPTIDCITPKQTLQLLKTPEVSTSSPLFDSEEFRSVPVQRAFQYLFQCDRGQSLDRYQYDQRRQMGTPFECLALVIRYCGISDPSWSELKHFIDFLNSQLHDCEQSYFTNPANFDDQWMQGTLKGFKSFVVKFMVTMSRDFATPSLDDNPIVCSAGASASNIDEDIRPLQLRRKWESSPHPYIFFNQDRITMTFLGFHVQSNGDLIDPDTGRVIEAGLLTKQLQNGLALQKVDFNANYNAWTKKQRIEKLCMVMGLNKVFDPDPTYELTIDNMKKILAIHMRFRCGIPVVIMGETGCGKTRLIRYMCALQAGTAGQRNMLLMKVHGGTSYEDIKAKVEQAEKMASENGRKGIDTVLFFDEANTTEALGMIKEVMVDRRINGRPVGVGLRRLHFIAACNPYRRHTDKMIGKLESAGLGYSVKATETKDKLGKIPLRHLVYRVHALPASMRPLVWDFGQLKPEIEELYIRQIVNRFIVIDKDIPGNERLVQAIARVLAAAQKYMRKQQDECSFVSLRDVERTMTVMRWFYQHHKHLRPQPQQPGNDDEQMDVSDSDDEVKPVDVTTWSLLLSLGVCYHAKLQDRKAFRECIIKSCSAPLKPNGGQREMLQEIDRCQKVLINELNLGPNIARNTALSENVFMMVVCIELRIPLFVIGKPGSSKSLAKTVVADNMQGEASKSPLFKRFKRAHMVSYQCSPLSTPEGIVATFRQCRRLQENNPGDRYASVVVLDEVGLAEDSPLLPLKTLHPLLEDGVTASDDIIETDEKPTRVAFIGISNWALDPAKMNRGLMLMRAEPDKKELEDSARGICSAREDIRNILYRLLKQLAAGYADLYKKQKTFQSLSNSKRDEFFGLRDFYSLVKMVYSIAAEKGDMLEWAELEHAIRRNFGGLDEIDAVEIFRNHVKTSFSYTMDGVPVKTLDLLRASLDHKNAIGESRYLLVITENYSALTIVEQQLIKNKDDYVVIFGSSFPKDQEYTQVCRNINQIKICMETGRTVVLLNLESLYESLYDALNQYYVYCAGQKYVDLGLGSHRVKCRVDDTFRLIVIAEKDVVYNKFPIPLINRLEKHYLVTSKSLERPQLNLVRDLTDWAQEFAEVRRLPHERQQRFTIGDAFIGYQSDTLPSMVLQVCSEDNIRGHDHPDEWAEQVKTKCQSLLVQSATPDAIARLPKTSLRDKADEMRNLYFVEQEHSSLSAYLGQLLSSSSDDENQNGLLVQVSTHSRLLSENDLPEICEVIGFKRPDVKLLHLQQFQTEQQFLKQIREFFIELANCEGILLVQCDSGDDNFNLIACTRHLLMDHRVKRQEMLTEKLQVEHIRPLHFVIIVQLPRLKGGCVNFVGFQGGHWESVHVDDLRPPSNQIPPIEFLIDRPISDLLKPSWLAEDHDIDSDLVEQGQNLSLEDIDVDMSDTDEMEIDDDDDVDELLKSTPVPSYPLPKPSKETFDAIVLIRRSIQAAAGRLEDEAVLAKRTTDRIDLILNLLPENSTKIKDGPSFAKSLHQKIYELLQEKNEKVSGVLASYWVRNEALSGTRMHERGTFRKALQYKVLSEIEPLLAKVLAFADRDCNLDLLIDKSQWLKSLWVYIFENKHLNEKYFDVSDTNMIREHVNVSGRGKHVFKCCFPFSWLVKDIVDGLGRGGADVSNRSCGTEEEKLRSILENSDLKEILELVKEEGKEEEAAERYLHDFVHMVYFPTKQCEQEEIELVSRFIMMAAEKESDSEDYIFDIATIHVTFNRVKSRISNFNQLVLIEPDITRLLLNQRRPMSIDVAALIGSLEKLEPNISELQNQEARNQWCGKVLAIRSSIEEMTSREAFTRKSDDVSGYDDNEKDLLRECWMMWQRLSAIRLFIAHVCSTQKLQNSRYLAKLCKVLGPNTNFITTRSVQSLEKFLVECSRDFKERNKICDTTCSVCMADAKCPSVTPCDHCFCLDCINRWISNNDTCPKCRVALPTGFKPTESDNIKKAKNTMNNFRDQCNSFFMEVVSLFCFGYSPCGGLGEDTYNLLMSYVTGQKGDKTKPFSPFKDAMDVTPVVRSFLLQQLLKSSDQKVKEYMEQFIKRAQDLVQVEMVAVEVFVMCVQCMEDAHNSKFSKRASELPLEQKVSLIDRYCKKACSVLSNPQSSKLNVDWLEGIAMIRFALSLAADLVYQYVNDSQEMQLPPVQRALGSIFTELQKICCNATHTRPRLFLLKQLSRRYGFESIGVVARKFAWILPQEGSETFEVSQDRFLVYRGEYQSLRETLARSIITGDVKAVEDILKGMTLDMTSKNVVLLLGLFQEITANPSVPIQEVVMKNLSSFIQESTLLNDQCKRLAQDLITEEHQDARTIASVFGLAGQSAWETSLVEIVVHLAAVLCSKGNDGVVGPLIALALNPATCINSLLPTMPDDPNQEVRAAGIGTMYECANGHPYVVTECGRPVEKGRCRARGCGAEIGGVNHTPVAGTRAATTADQTKRGHCLGSPNDRAGSAERAPERDLSPLATCLIRLLVHGSMLIGSCYNLQSVTQLISPNVRQDTVQRFLWQHLIRDIQLVSQVSGRSVDDTALTIHLLLQSISCQAHVAQPNGWNVLQERLQRRRWENHFSTVIIVPVMTNLGRKLQETVQLIARDKRFGANPLLRQLYELESGAEDLTRSVTPNCTALWRYRTPITLSHVTRKFNESAVARSADCAILGEFLKQEQDLRAVKHLPDVVKLQKLLMDRYHRSLDRTETDKLKVKDFYKQIPKGTVAEYKALVQSFRSAWAIMVASVKDKGTKGPIKKLCENKVQEDTPISMFIPAKSGLGACSLTLVKFLVDKHNEFLEVYRQHAQIRDIQHVGVLEVTCSQLLSYDTDRDLIPLVHAHCHYSLEPGQGTSVEYDWSAVQRHLIDRLVRGRSIVDFKDEEYTKTAVINAQSVLTSLKAKIHQVELSLAIQHQIVQQYRSLQDVCEALSSLHIAITFLSSGGGRSDMSIHRYLHDVLKMPGDSGLRNNKVNEVCQLQHSVSLWRLLSIERAKLFTKSGKDPFEHLPEDYKEQVTETMQMSVRETLKKLSDANLDVLVSLLIEIIMLQLNDDFDIDKEYSLREYITYNPLHEDSEIPTEVNSIPETVQLRHVFGFWQILISLSDRSSHERRVQATG